MKNRFYAFLLLSVLLIGSLVGCGGGDSNSPASESTPINQIIPQKDIVAHGSNSASLATINSTTTISQGDAIRVYQGGEGLLDFGNALRLRLFNDTQTNVVSLVQEDDAPLEVAMYLEEGGFTGELTTSGGQALFTTPNGTEITILGTTFFVLHNAAVNETLVGNFKGTIQVANGGLTATVPISTYLTIPDTGIISPPQPLNVSATAFANNAQLQFSPLTAFQPSQVFIGSLGVPVEQDIPDIGAGHIEISRTQDIYLFDIPAGEIGYIDMIEHLVTNTRRTFDWQMLSPSGTTIFDQSMSVGDFGRYEFTEDGTYTIIVDHPSIGVGLYSFQIWPVAPDNEYEISIGEAVDGEIRTPGTENHYHFTTTIPEHRLYLQIFAYEFANSLNNFNWRLENSQGDVLFENCFAKECDIPEFITLPEAGTYTITIYHDQGGYGIYSFGTE